MEFKIANSALLAALDKLHNISQTKNVRPILANTLIDGTGDLLKISTTDLEISMTVSRPGILLEMGRITLPTQELYRMAGKMRADEELHFVEEENFWMTIRAGRSRFRLAGLDPEEYPELPVVAKGEALSIPCKAFGNMIDHCLFSVSTDINKKVLNGVLFETDQDGRLTLVATDGHRLAKVDARLEKVPDSALKGTVLPGKGLKEIRRILANREGSFQMTIGESAARIVEGDFEMVLRFLEGTFPEYQRVIPPSTRIKVSFDAKELSEALGRVSVFATDKYMGVKFTIQSGETQLSFNNPGIGEATESVGTDFTGEPLGVSFNARYLTDILDNLEGKTAVLELNEVQSPCVFRGSRQGLDMLYIVMPMML